MVSIIKQDALLIHPPQAFKKSCLSFVPGITNGVAAAAAEPVTRLRGIGNTTVGKYPEKVDNDVGDPQQNASNIVGPKAEQERAATKAAAGRQGLQSHCTERA